jgi:electron transport complex protein RnfC
MLTKIKDAGVVGLGGAGFPAGFKLDVRPDVKLDKLILNGAECEPYLTSDHRVMVEYPKDIVEGAKMMLKILGINYCAIGIENNKPDAIESLNKVISEDRSKNGYNIVVKPLKVQYPQGSADQLMQAVTGRARPAGVRSSAIGIIVQNVYTTKAVYEAVALDKPLYERIVTLTGKGIKRPANVMVKVGTSISEIVDYLGGTTPGLAKVIAGGPMMGFAISTLDVPVTKTTSGVLFLTRDEINTDPHLPCISCGFCVDVCPMGLEPNNVSRYVEAGRGADTEEFGVDDCFLCGSCAYVCPAKRPLVQFMNLAKNDIRKSKKK